MFATCGGEMVVSDFVLAGCVSVLAGLDRTAALQLMISRPIVAAPLTGWLLGDPFTGLHVGALVELLWLGRLPVGAAIPPDDTQVAVSAVALAVILGPLEGAAALPFTLLAVMVALPLGKIGQVFDRMVRHYNGRLLHKAQRALDEGRLRAAENCHLQGLLHFSASSLATFVVIVSVGAGVLHYSWPHLREPFSQAGNWLTLAFPLVGVSIIWGTGHVARGKVLFCSSFVAALLLLWLM